MQFQKGQGGNPLGRPPGARNKATLIAEALLQGEAAELTRAAIERAKAGMRRCGCAWIGWRRPPGIAPSSFSCRS
jgi:hypothetical protein